MLNYPRLMTHESGDIWIATDFLSFLQAAPGKLLLWVDISRPLQCCLFTDTHHPLFDSTATSILLLFSQRQWSSHLINESWLISWLPAASIRHQLRICYSINSWYQTAPQPLKWQIHRKRPVCWKKCFMTINLLKISTGDKNAIYLDFLLFFPSCPNVSNSPPSCPPHLTTSFLIIIEVKIKFRKGQFWLLGSSDSSKAKSDFQIRDTLKSSQHNRFQPPKVIGWNFI